MHPAVQNQIILKLSGPNTSAKEVAEIRKVMLSGRTGSICKIGKIQYGKLVPGDTSPSYKVEFKKLKKTPSKFAKDSAYIDSDKASSLKTRTPKPGDRLQPIGLNGTKKLQDIFVDKKIPQPVRKTIPVIISGKEIVCVGWLATSEKFKITEDTKNITKITFKQTK